MKNNALTRSIEADLSLDVPFIKGQNKPIRNCWHFCTDGDSVQCMFYDEQDFIDGMNRIYIVSQQYRTTILAFVLMDTHIHFVLHGDYDECNKFIHEYVRRTSLYLENRHKLSKALKHIRINSQCIDNDNYLKTVICYVCKNPVAAGLPFTFYDYPWSSAPLYFRTMNWWTEPRFCDQRHIQDYDSLAYSEKERLLKTRNIKSINSLRVIDKIIFPGEYVSVETVHRIYKTAKSFLFFMSHTKEYDVESRGLDLSRMSIPIQEMRQLKNSLCKEMFNADSSHDLNVSQRIRLAKALKYKYNCSNKQLARVCGLVLAEFEKALNQ